MRQGKGKGRCKNSLPLTKNFSQNVTDPSKGITVPIHYIVIHLVSVHHIGDALRGDVKIPFL